MEGILPRKRFQFDMARLNIPKTDEKKADEEPKEKPKMSESESDAMIAFLQKAT